MYPDHPTIDIDFLISLLRESPKIISTIKEGETAAYIMKGNRPIGERIILIPTSHDGQVDFEFATGIAIKIKAMPALMTWLEKNRGWKDGAYNSTSTVKATSSAPSPPPPNSEEQSISQEASE